MSDSIKASEKFIEIYMGKDMGEERDGWIKWIGHGLTILIVAALALMFLSIVEKAASIHVKKVDIQVKRLQLQMLTEKTSNTMIDDCTNNSTGNSDEKIFENCFNSLPDSVKPLFFLD